MYYFISYLDSSHDLLYRVLQSFAQQLLINSTSFAPYIVEKFVDERLRPTKESLKHILQTLITSLSSVRIVLDGLDECPQSEYDEIIDYVQEVGKLVPVLFSGRNMPGISGKLQSKAIVRLSDYSSPVIIWYIDSRLSCLGLAPDVARYFLDQVVAKSEGDHATVCLSTSVYGA